MNTKRFLILQVILLAGLGTVFFLPKHVEMPAAGVKLALPAYIGMWYGESAEVTQREREVLGPETRFARRRYEDGIGGRIDTSIVLSGEDMNTSIHRPERCLPAQGFTLVGSHSRVLRVGGRPLRVTRLHAIRPIPANEEHPAFTEHTLHYYWFIGSSETTASHFSRELIDIRDRILKGTVQRWAYVTLSSPVTKGQDKFGRSEADVDQALTAFIEKLVPEVELPAVIRR